MIESGHDPLVPPFYVLLKPCGHADDPGVRCFRQGEPMHYASAQVVALKIVGVFPDREAVLQEQRDAVSHQFRWPERLIVADLRMFPHEAERDGIVARAVSPGRRRRMMERSGSFPGRRLRIAGNRER